MVSPVVTVDLCVTDERVTIKATLLLLCPDINTVVLAGGAIVDVICGGRGDVSGLGIFMVRIIVGLVVVSVVVGDASVDVCTDSLGVKDDGIICHVFCTLEASLVFMD